MPVADHVPIDLERGPRVRVAELPLDSFFIQVKSTPF
jgi:hypothetical protein